jgi:hypothetical protein
MRREGGEIIHLKRTIVLAKTKALLYPQIEKEVKRVQTTGTAIVFPYPLRKCRRIYSIAFNRIPIRFKEIMFKLS